MDPISFISGIISLMTVVCGLVETEELLKYPNEMKELRDQLNEEKAKGVNADDGKIESLCQKIDSTRQAFEQAVELLARGKTVSASVSTPAAPAPIK